MRVFNFLFVFCICLAVISCSGSKKSTRKKPTVEKTEENEPSKKVDDEESNLNLETHRTKLSDSYASKSNRIPEYFTHIREQPKTERNIYEGYRIQIFSGEKVDMADKTASQFRMWADTTIVGYQPETYVFFKPPYYRVHVGDFHERDAADAFSNIVKRYFKDAWVVYDQVDPQSVPADTANIRTQ